MANANPSGPGYAVETRTVRPEPNHAAGKYAVRLDNGDVELWTTTTVGNVIKQRVFADDYSDEETITPAEFQKILDGEEASPEQPASGSKRAAPTRKAPAKKAE